MVPEWFYHKVVFFFFKEGMGSWLLIHIMHLIYATIDITIVGQIFDIMAEWSTEWTNKDIFDLKMDA